jgi:GT2 family glycosyltransferase
MLHPQDTRAWDCDWVTGAVWLINRRAWNKLGPLREDVTELRDYRHFESDREWCMRAKEQGWRVLCAPHSVTHYYRQSTPLDWQHT